MAPSIPRVPALDQAVSIGMPNGRNRDIVSETTGATLGLGRGGQPDRISPESPTGSLSGSCAVQEARESGRPLLICLNMDGEAAAQQQ